jgi:hypothetical protein
MIHILGSNMLIAPVMRVNQAWTAMEMLSNSFDTTLHNRK